MGIVAEFGETLPHPISLISSFLDDNWQTAVREKLQPARAAWLGHQRPASISFSRLYREENDWRKTERVSLGSHKFLVKGLLPFLYVEELDFQ